MLPDEYLSTSAPTRHGGPAPPPLGSQPLAGAGEAGVLFVVGLWLLLRRTRFGCIPPRTTGVRAPGTGWIRSR